MNEVAVVFTPSGRRGRFPGERAPPRDRREDQAFPRRVARRLVGLHPPQHEGDPAAGLRGGLEIAQGHRLYVPPFQPAGLAEPGDKIGITAGLPAGSAGGTNLFKVHDID